MSKALATAVLRGESSAVAFGLSWVTPEALRVLTWQDSGEDSAETLAAVAVAMQLDLVFVPAAAQWAHEAVRFLRHADVASAWAVSGVLGRLAIRQGWASVLARSANEPGALAFDLSEVLHDALVEVRAGGQVRADALVIADDLAGPAGWLVAPDFAMEALVPCYRQLAAQTDVPAVFHSDGDVRALYASLAQAGFSAVHVAVPGQDAIERAVIAAHDAGLIPVGGIEAGALLASSASRAGMRAGALGAHGALIVCDDGGMTSAEELAAYTTALRAARVSAELL